MAPTPNGAQATPPPSSAADQDGFGSVPGRIVVAAAETDTEPGSTFSWSTWAVARATLVVALVVGGLYLLWKIQEVLLLLLLAILFATAIEPIVNYLRRGPFSRAQGVLIVYTALFLLLTGLGALLVPTLLDEATRLVDSVPRQIAALHLRAEQ